MAVIETFFAVGVLEMQRATAFYVDALGATVAFASPGWSSLRIAGVRIGLFPAPAHAPGTVGVHFVVDNLVDACDAVERAGGRIADTATEVAPGVTTINATDTEGNTFTLRQV